MRERERCCLALLVLACVIYCARLFMEALCSRLASLSPPWTYSPQVFPSCLSLIRKAAVGAISAADKRKVQVVARQPRTAPHEPHEVAYVQAMRDASRERKAPFTLCAPHDDTTFYTLLLRGSGLLAASAHPIRPRKSLHPCTV
jgi:hypothetical protein